MKDDELVAGFEQGTLPAAAFGHREHLRLAWLYLARHGRADTERRLLAGLRAFAARAGQPARFSAPLTAAWIAIVADATAQHPDAASFDELVAAAPQLLDRTAGDRGR